MERHDIHITVEDGTMLEVSVDKAIDQAVGVVHIFHGMAEHKDRYDGLAASLNKQGYDVIRHNHRGHGKDIDASTRGHYNKMTDVVRDAYEIAQTLYGQSTLPYIVLGHSMGSIIARKFVQTYPEFVNGLILTGTSQYSRVKGVLMSSLLKLVTWLCGKKRRMAWLNNQVFNTFNRKIKPRRTDADWISSDPNEVDAYVQDPYSGFFVSNQLFYEVMHQMHITGLEKEIRKINPSMPVLLIAGKADAFGDYGRGVRRFGKYLKRGGVSHITVHLYKNKRHEILFEIDHQHVWSNMYDWMAKQILK